MFALLIFFLLLNLIPFLFFLIFQKKITHPLVSKLSGIFFLAQLCLAGWICFKIFTQGELLIQQVWITMGNKPFYISFLLYNLSSLVVFLVIFIAGLVQLFSTSYMEGDKHYARFFAYLHFFVFAMLGIVLSNNLLLTYIFWELVGVGSYLLIGFWQEKKSATQASKKAFIINKIGDIGFLIGLGLLYWLIGDLNLGAIAQNVNALQPYQTAIGLCLFCGAVAKSAQFPLHTWLPDAMEGPTPASALIHAATMVAAGVFLMARIAFLLTPSALEVIAIIGAITAFIGAFSALTQTDIKKVLAYSTISQLGYMILGIGIGAFQASVFHLFTHAFFKACLFLGAGAIIYQLHKIEKSSSMHFDVQDMRLMGGLGKKMPFVGICYSIAALSLIGLPLFSGFLSKEVILVKLLHWTNLQNNILGYFVTFLAFLTLLLTAFYVSRQLFLIFLGDWRLTKQYPSLKTSIFPNLPFPIKIPLIVLSIFSTGFVFSIVPTSYVKSWLLQKLDFVHEIYGKEQFTFWLATLLSIFGVGLAYLVYQKNYLNHWINHHLKASIFYKLSFNSFYIDQFYQQVIAKFFMKFSTQLARFDKRWLDGAVNFLAKSYVICSHIVAWLDHVFVDGVVKALSNLLKKIGLLIKNTQKMSLQRYFLMVFISLLLVLYWILGK